MNLIYQVVKNVEVKKITEKVRSFIINNPSHSLLIALGLILLYAIYGAASLQIITHLELELKVIFINLVKISLIVSTFFVIIFRNIFKTNDFVFFYLNTRIKAYQIILSRILLPSVFYYILLVLASLPVMISVIIKDYTIDLAYLLLLLVIFIISYFLCFTIWMVVNIFIVKFTGVKERFWLNTFIKVAVIAGLIMIINPLEVLLGGNSLLHFIVIILLGISVSFLFVKLSLKFLNNCFMQKDAGTLSPKYTPKKLDYNSKFLLQSKLETIHFFRNQVFVEQGFFFIILMVLVIGLYYSLELVNFSLIYSMLINFGLKEIMLLLPLTIGIHFKEYMQAIYSLNIGKYQYFLSRLLIIYLLNCITYFLFIMISYTVTRMEVYGILETFISIAFITMLSTMVGFVIKINELNKVYVIIILLISVNIFDMFIKQLLNHPILVQFTYISLAVMLFLIIETVYLRRPIVK